MIEFYGSLADRYPIVSIEDGLDENSGTTGAASRTRSATACSSSATTSS